MSYKTSYCVKWEESYPWLKSVKTDKYSAYCKACSKEFRIDGGGITQVKSHGKSKTHESNLKLKKGERTYTNASNLTLSKPLEIPLAPEDQAVKAEIIQALKTVASNYSFASADGDSKRFKVMFPNSKIAENYKQCSTKIKYAIQYGNTGNTLCI